MICRKCAFDNADVNLSCSECGAPLISADASFWIDKGNALLAADQLDEGMACYERALEIDPRQADALVNKGTALARLGRPAEAVTCFERALEIKPEWEAAWYNLGHAFRELSRWEDALRCYDRSLQMKADKADTWSYKGFCLAGLNRFQEALTCFEEAQRLGHPGAVQAIAVCRDNLASEMAANGAGSPSPVTAPTVSPQLTESQTDCALHADVVCVPCANCATPLCRQCTETGVLNKLAPSGLILCGECHRQAVLRPGFCPDCEMDIRDVKVVDNFVKANFFSNFFGEAEQCPKCNSVVRTLWIGSIFPTGFMVLPFVPIFANTPALRPYIPALFRISVIPLVPLASYRDRIGLAANGDENDQTQFQRGRTSLRWNQLFRTALFWFIPIGLVILFLVILSFLAKTGTTSS